jgi:hemerythrin-like metal-binding protein
MPFMQWSDMLMIDGGDVDTQHRQLVDAINAFHDAVARGCEASEAASTLDTLQRYGETHFADEEALLTEALYPKLDQHRRQHRLFIEQIAAFRQQLAGGSPGLGHAMGQFLGSWLVNHIMVADKAYAAFLRSSSARMQSL